MNASEPFVVGTNALIVNYPTANALADAVLALIRQPGLRNRLSTKARETILSYFTLSRQIGQYTTLYRLAIVSSKRQTTG